MQYSNKNVNNHKNPTLAYTPNRFPFLEKHTMKQKSNKQKVRQKEWEKMFSLIAACKVFKVQEVILLYTNPNKLLLFKWLSPKPEANLLPCVSTLTILQSQDTLG